MKVSIPRLHSARLKSGGATLQVIYPASSPTPMTGMARKIESELSGVVGCAIVAWSSDGTYAAEFVVDRVSPYHSIQVPDLVRAALLREMNLYDTNNAINRSNGYGETDDQ
jgi:hypothetical protein